MLVAELDRLDAVWNRFKNLNVQDLEGDEILYREMKNRFGKYFAGSMGADAIQKRLQTFDLEAESESLREIIATVPEARRLNDLTRADPDAHREMRALGEIVAREVRTRQELTAEDIVSRLEPRALRQAVAEPTGAHFLNVSFLVPRDRVPAFSEAVHREAEQRGDAYALNLNGPLPPYSFV